MRGSPLSYRIYPDTPLLLLAAGRSVQALAERQGLCREAVRIRRCKWLKSSLASLPDRPRSGSPSS